MRFSFFEEFLLCELFGELWWSARRPISFAVSTFRQNRHNYVATIENASNFHYSDYYTILQVCTAMNLNNRYTTSTVSPANTVVCASDSSDSQHNMN